MVAGVRHEGRPQIIARHVRPGDVAILRRDSQNSHSPNAIGIFTASGHQVGFMPEDYAEHWAAIMDGGAQVRATFAKLLTEGRAPIPVVVARFYGPDARLDEVSAAGPPSRPTKLPSSLIWLAIVIAAVLILVALV